MYVRLGAVVLLFVFFASRADARTPARGSLSVAVTAQPIATVAVDDASSPELVCVVPAGARGLVPCRGIVMLRGHVRTTATTRFVDVHLQTSAATEDGLAVDAAAVQVRCGTQTVGSEGTCARWSGPWIGEYRIPVAASLDATNLKPGTVVRIRLAPSITLLP